MVTYVLRKTGYTTITTILLKLLISPDFISAIQGCNITHTIEVSNAIIIFTSFFTQYVYSFGISYLTKFFIQRFIEQYYFPFTTQIYKSEQIGQRLKQDTTRLTINIIYWNISFCAVH